MDLKAAFTRANSTTPTKSATTLEVGKYFPIERMERKTTKYGDQVLVTFTTGQKVWLPNSFSRELRDEIISYVRPGEWELSFQGMQLVSNRYTKAQFNVRAVPPAHHWGDEGDFTPPPEEENNERSPSIL